jgi:hypothetical protein
VFWGGAACQKLRATRSFFASGLLRQGFHGRFRSVVALAKPEVAELQPSILVNLQLSPLEIQKINGIVRSSTEFFFRLFFEINHLQAKKSVQMAKMTLRSV